MLPWVAGVLMTLSGGKASLCLLDGEGWQADHPEGPLWLQIGSEKPRNS